MNAQWSAVRGMTLMELLIALGLGASLSAALMQVFTGGLKLQSVQNSVQDLQQRSAYAQFLLRTAIYQSASPCSAPAAGLHAGEGPSVAVLAGPAAGVAAIPGSQVLRVLTGDCETPVHDYFIGRGASADDSPAGLFRRRQRNDGSYYRSEELIEGVIAMTATVGVTVPMAREVPAIYTGVAYIGADQVVDWAQVFSINLTLSLRQITAAGKEGSDGLTMTFSTALRQTELSPPVPVSE